MFEKIRNNKTLYNTLIYAGLAMIAGGLALVFNDSMCGGWCSASMKKPGFSIREYLNGPLILILGVLTIAYPAIHEIKKWKQEG